MKNVLTTLLEVVGLVFVTVGFWQLSHPAGLIVGGMLTVLGSAVVSR